MNFPQLASNIRAAHSALQQNAMLAVNQNVTARNWLVGLWIVEFEQNGEDRAKYGEKLLSSLAKAIEIKGLGKSMLNVCRQFYKVYPELGVEIGKYLFAQPEKQMVQPLIENLQILESEQNIKIQTVFGKSEEKDTPIFQTLSGKSQKALKQSDGILSSSSETLPRVPSDKLFGRISFSHFAEFLSIDDPLKRTFYEVETIKGCWSVRELRRQIDTLCYERAGFSKNPEKLLALVNEKADLAQPVNVVKSPYIFDFLGLKNAEVVEENDLETQLISHIQDFILELGDGFCFESRQKRIIIDNEYFFIDLVFYHRVLKCHVLVELKTQKFNYADMAQLNMYVAYYRENMMTEGDNPPIGILLCTDATTEMVKYATAGMDENLFISKYLLQLPAKEKFIEFIHNELNEL